MSENSQSLQPGDERRGLRPDYDGVRSVRLTACRTWRHPAPNSIQELAQSHWELFLCIQPLPTARHHYWYCGRWSKHSHFSSDDQSFTLAQLRFRNQQFNTNQNIHFRTSWITSDVKNSHEFASRINFIQGTNCNNIKFCSLMAHRVISEWTIDQDLNTHNRIC